ncbi:MAG: 2-oxo acid dehydrogenase subunit E2 [Nitrospinae bacterium]|nr:2-oxo acid dehydrogenase subunit E2 [Nitrospinota bacterium]
MATQVKMPKLGQTMEEGTVLTWLKREGERVAQGEPLVQIETDKVVCDVEASASGFLHTIVARAGEKIPVGKPIAVIATEGEVVDLVALLGTREPATLGAPPMRGTERTAARTGVSSPLIASAEPSPPKEMRISPAARKLSREHGIPLDSLRGTGPAGRIVVEDVERAIAVLKASAPPQERVLRTIPLTGIRGTIAQRMTQSWAQVAHVTEVMEVDMTQAVALRRRKLPTWEREYGVRVSLSDFLTFAVSRALREFPDLNARLEGQEIKVLEDIHLGVAVAISEGLIVPVIRHADRRSLGEIAQESARLATKAQERKLTLDEVSGGTFTITNLGSYGIEIFTPIVNYPQCAILGVGRVAERPVAAPGRIDVRAMMYLSLSFDHRIIDGAPAARFLQQLKENLETLTDFPA